MRRLPHLLIPAALSLLALGGCGSNGSESGSAVAVTSASAGDTAADPTIGSTAPEASTQPADASVPDTRTVPQALQFSAPLVGGGTFDAAAYAGKPLALWFWGPT